MDFEQPRALWQKVFDDTAKEHFVGNVAGHLGKANAEIKARQRMFPVFSQATAVEADGSFLA